MHDREDTLLHLSSVFSSQDDNFASLEVDLDGGGGGHTGGETIGWELTGIVDCEVGGTKLSEFFGGRSDQHVVHLYKGQILQSATAPERSTGDIGKTYEKSVVSTSADDSDLDAVLGVPSSETVKDTDEDVAHRSV